MTKTAERPTGDLTVRIRVAAMQDQRLSRRARGLLAELLSRPPGWKTSAEGLARVGPEGRDAMRATLIELENAGYLTRTRTRSRDGRVHGVVWEVSDLPGRPATVSRIRPAADFQPLADQPPVDRRSVRQPPVDQPPTRQPRRGRETEKRDTPPPPAPAGPPKAERVKALGVVVVDGLKGRAPTPGRGTLLVACDRLADEGWSPDELGTAVAGHDWTGAGAGAVIAYLRGLTAADRRPLAQKPAQERPAWCGTCDKPSRLLLDDQGRPRRGQRCPDCHPLAKKAR